MSADTPAAPTHFEAAALETLIVNLRNAHALEKQVIAVLESQLKTLTEYPDLHARLSEHVVESRDQRRRLEAGLEACGTSSSMVKDALLSVMGLGQSSVQGFSEDAVLKALAADMMTEKLEIATYRILLSLAEMAGKPDLSPRLQESLREEEAMADWLDQNLEAVTRRFVEIKAAKMEPDPIGMTGHGAESGGQSPQSMVQSMDNPEGSGAYPRPTADARPGTLPVGTVDTGLPEPIRPSDTSERDDGTGPRPAAPGHVPTDP